MGRTFAPRQARISVGAALGAALLVLALPAVAAHAAAPQTGEHCAVVIEKLRPGQTESRVVSHECGHDPRLLRAAKASTRLMTWFDKKGFSVADGARSFAVFGSEGPCDTAGYAISDVARFAHDDFWHDRISSYKTYAGCDEQHLCRAKDFDWCVSVDGYDVEDVGWYLDDEIDSMKIRNG
jgi:hypothetical protein